MDPKSETTRPVRWRAHPNFILLVVGFAIFSDQFLFACITPVLPFILLSRLHIREDAIQSATSISLAAFFITSILTPVFVAFFGRHQALRRRLYVVGLLCLAIATVTLYFAQTFAVFILSRILQGTSGSIVWVVGMGMICDAVGTDGLGQATGTVFGLAMMGTMVAPAIGGALYRYSGVEGIFFVSLAILAIDLILRLLVLEPDKSLRSTKASTSADPESVSGHDDAPERSVNERTPLKPNPAASAQQPPRRILPDEASPETSSRGLKSSLLCRAPILKTMLYPVMWTSMAIVVLQAVFLSFIDATIPLRLGQTLAFDAFDSGLMLLIITGMIVIVAPIAGWLTDRYQPRMLAIAGLVIAALGLGLLGLPLPESRAARVAVFAIYLATFGLGIACLDSPAFVASAKLVEDLFHKEPENFGEEPPFVEHQAIVYTFYSTGMVVGPLVAAGLSRVVSFEGTAFVLSAVTVGLSVVSFWYL